MMLVSALTEMHDNQVLYSLKYECHDEKPLILTDLDITFVQARVRIPNIFFFKIPKMDGIFHYFNESFVIDPLNDFERHFAWLSKTPLLLKIGQSP